MSYAIFPSGDLDYGMSHSDMIQEVADQARNSSLLDSSGNSTRITRWLNMEVSMLASQYIFPDLHASSTFTTTSGTRNYGLATDIEWLKLIWDPVGIQFLFPISERELALMDPNFNTQIGHVTHYILNNKAVDLYKIPDTSRDFAYSYQRRPLKLIGLTDYSDLPYAWHNVITQGALIKAFKFENNDQYRTALEEYRFMVRPLRRKLHKRLDWFRVFRPQITTARIPRPTLPPDHFPRVF